MINIVNCQSSNDKYRIGHTIPFPKDGNRNRNIEPCETNISGFIQDNLVIFFCGSEDFLVEHILKKSQRLAE